jgi:hypothetical protein
LALALAAPVDVSAQHPPITIPPAAQITPPAAPPAAPGSPPGPRSLLPTEIETLRDPLGAGIVMYGQLTGKADSALGVISAIFAYSQAFDPTPTPLLAVADQNDRAAQALFAGAVHGVPILGVAAVALRDFGGDVRVFYDYADSLGASFPRLQQALGDGGGDAGLGPIHLGDGSEIGVGPGWRVIGQGKNVVDLSGPQGEFMTLGDAIRVYAGPTALAGAVAQGPCCDPAEALQAAFPQLAAAAQRRGLLLPQLTGIAGSAATAPPSGGQAALILADLTVGGRPYRYLVFAEATGGFTDPWTLRLSGAMAPSPVFATELPVLLAIWGSYSANPAGFTNHLKDAAQAIPGLQPMLQSPFSATSTAVYRADSGWNDAIRAVETSSNQPISDAISQHLLDQLAKDSGRTWHIAPAPAR